MVSCICIMVTCVAFATNVNGRAANARCGLSISTRAQHTISNKLSSKKTCPLCPNVSPSNAFPNRLHTRAHQLPSQAQGKAPRVSTHLLSHLTAGSPHARSRPERWHCVRRPACCRCGGQQPSTCCACVRKSKYLRTCRPAVLGPPCAWHNETSACKRLRRTPRRKPRHARGGRPRVQPRPG